MATITGIQNLKAAKKQLRTALTAKLRDIPCALVHDQSQLIASRILALPAFNFSSSIGCFLNMPKNEVKTTSLAKAILRAGKKLYVPKVDYSQERRMEFLRVYDEEDLESLHSGKWGIREPDSQRMGEPRQSGAIEGLDLILLPGLAFDRSFHRLGHGKGYYDHFISAYVQSRERPHLVALVLREQLLGVDEVPVGQWDWNVDLIVTPDEVVGL